MSKCKLLVLISINVSYLIHNVRKGLSMRKLQFKDITPEKGMKIWTIRPNENYSMEYHELILDREWGSGGPVQSWIGMSEKPGYLTGSHEYVVSGDDPVWFYNPTK